MDELGPAKVIQVREPGLGLDAVLVVDNVACGPSIGGLRMAPDVSIDECLRLARAMTLKMPPRAFRTAAANPSCAAIPGCRPPTKSGSSGRSRTRFAARTTTSSARTWGPMRPAWHGSRTRSVARSGCHPPSAESRSTSSARPAGESGTPRRWRPTLRPGPPGRPRGHPGLRRRWPTQRALPSGVRRRVDRGLRLHGHRSQHGRPRRRPADRDQDGRPERRRVRRWRAPRAGRDPGYRVRHLDPGGSA